MSKSLDGLKTAFAGESQANRKYLAYAAQAEKAGYTQAARLFKAAAEAETIHALNHFKAMDGVGTIEDNLKDALAGETYEVEDMYPPFLAAAQEEENKKAARTFNFALQVEQEHQALFSEMLENLAASKEDVFAESVCPGGGSSLA
jgi:rubrerythrin